MNIVNNHIRELLNKDFRLDGRRLDEYRKITIERGVSSKSAEGSARVTIGDTTVIAGIKMEVAKPYPDMPNAGTMMVGVELLPLSSPEFETGPPDIQAIELARACVDRGIRESEAIPFEKLCIKEGEKVWNVLIDIYSFDDHGNLADAVGLAASAALQDAKFPKYDEKEEKVLYEEKTNKGLPLGELPATVTVLRIKDKFIVDPTTEEEKAADARLTVSSLEDGRICALQKGGDESLSQSDIMKMVDISLKKGKELRKLLK